MKNIQIFLEFASFYQQFIVGFSQTIKSLIKVTKSSHVTTRLGKNKIKYNLFQWTENCGKIFQDLKQVFMTGSVLVYNNPKLET